MSSAEELYETLIDLENERVISKKINLESDNLLKGLKILVDQFNEKTILVDVISVLRDIVGCENVIIMTTESNHKLITQASTSDLFYDIQLEPQTFLKRIISGDISVSFDTQSIPEWSALPKESNWLIKSTVHMGLGFNEKDSILICCDSRPNFFNQSHADLIKRYSTLITQALINLASQDKISILNRNLLDTARKSGMADVAISVLHGIGNVLNSLSVSSEMLQNKINNLSLAKLSELVTFLKNDTNDQSRYFTENTYGKTIFKYLSLIALETDKEKTSFSEEINSMKIHINRIKNIVSMQQTISKPSNVVTEAMVSTLIDNILDLYRNQIKTNKITVVHRHENETSIMTDQFQVEKICRNLIQNGLDSVISCKKSDKKVDITCERDNDDIIIRVSDNGLGIPQSNIDQIFNFGFTTKGTGHGFGLHYSALIANELGGKLTVNSKGENQGAEFILTLVPMRA